ncbi:MAG TPA: translation initiation factor IF-2 [Candidatus Copromonas avistercoris]|nr:translation initiation factor IF-2 [Candidatus Copromonas avistercoris]
MKVNELAKDLEKTNKEVNDTLQKNVEEKNNASGTAGGQAAEKKEPAGKPEENKADAPAQPAKKRIAAVYRPQNSSQKGRSMGQSRPQGQRPARPAGAGMQVRPTTASSRTQTGAQAGKGQALGTQGKKTAPAGRMQGADAAVKAQEAGRTSAPSRPSAEATAAAFEAVLGTKKKSAPQPATKTLEQAPVSAIQAGDAQTGAVKQEAPAAAPVSPAPAVHEANESRPAEVIRDNKENRQPAAREGRETRTGEGSRDGGSRQGSYQGSRDGNRDGGSRQGGYQGSRDGNRDGGSRQGGYQGSRDGGSRQGGYQGSRDGGNRQGGYQGGRDGSGRQGGGRGGMNIPKPSFDSPMAQKQQNTKASKNAYKKEHDAKRDRDDDLRGKNSRGGKGVKAPVMQAPKKEEAKVEEIKTIVIPEVITIKELAEKMKLQPSAIVKKLFLQGTIVTINQEIDFEKAEEIAMDYDVLCEKEKKVNVIEELLKEDEEDEKDMVPRPPVICVMGHVDHGKTSLLDAIRQTNVTAKEAGGITQHIGAYVVEYNGQRITFLDTPGHEAFTAMRMRGAQATDIAILVVAADDGVMPQTVEAINHAKAAGVEIIVAVNKIDKPSANVERVKQELSEYELIPEDWGGSTVFVPVSAHTKEGIPELLEMILLTAEVKELKANPNRKARGLVIEAQLDKGRGPVATVLVQKGTLRVGDAIAAGSCHGKVRAMMDDKGNRVKEAGPSTPVEILGLNDVPNAGEVFVALQNEKEARSFAETFIAEGKNKLLEDTKAKLSLDDLFSQIKAGNVKELPIIVKADVQGSVEAVKQSLEKLSNEEVMVKVIHGGVGTINESDVTLASASNAIIIGFNVRPDATAKSIADREKVDMRLYRVIYQAIEDVEAAMKGMLDPIFEEQVIGHAIVRQTFKASGVGTIAGSYVLDGKIQRGCKARVTRDGEQLFDGPLASLKRFKDDVKEVNAGYECGLVFEGFNDLQEDDTIELYMMVEVPR